MEIGSPRRGVDANVRIISGWQSANKGRLVSAGNTRTVSERAFLPLYLEAKDRTQLATLLEAINIKRKTVFEFENTPFSCMDSEISTPTARGGQTLVRLKMRNLLTSAVLDKTFKAGEKFKEPDLQLVPVSYLYSDGDGSYFLDQDSFETLNLSAEVVGNALDLLVEGALLHLHKYNGNPISLQLPMFVELEVVEAEPAVRGDTSSGSGTKMAKLETGLEIRVPLFIKQGEKVKIATETREFSGRA
jgi:elongation factor P